MRRIIEQQRCDLAAAHHFEQLQLVVGRITALRSREVPVAIAEKQLGVTVFAGHGLMNACEDFLRQFAAVIEIVRCYLNRSLMIVRG